jgi:ABC-type polysaccharide/polyol phosphate export permease
VQLSSVVKKIGFLMFDKAISDLKSTVSMSGAAWFFAWGDLKTRYRRSALGPMWLVLSTAIGVAGLGYVWATLLKMEISEFVPTLTIGLVVWQLVSGCLTESSNVIYKNSKIIKNLKVPFCLFSLQLLMKQFLNFAHNLVVILAVLLIFSREFSFIQLLAIPGLIIVLLSMFWVTTLVGILAARFRDFEALIASIMPLLFFLSPVLYKPENLGVKGFLMWFNPFSYFIAVIRDPLQGQIPPLFVYVGALVIMLITAFLSMFTLDKKYKRIAFWV